MGRPMRNTAEAGYTVLEAIIVVAIFAIAFISIYAMFDTNWSVYRKGEARSNVQQNARLALEQMSTEIRQASFFPESFGMYPNPPGPVCGALANGAFPIWVGVTGDGDQDGALVIYGDVDPNIAPRPPCSNFVRYSVVNAGGVSVLCRAVGDTATNAWGTACAPSATMASLASLPIVPGVVDRPITLRIAFYDACGRPLPNAQVLDNGTEGYRLDTVTLTGARPADPSPFVAGCGAAVPNLQERAAVQRVLITLTLRENVPGQGVQTYTLTSDVRLRNWPRT